jgi:hypothetical protein
VSQVESTPRSPAQGQQGKIYSQAAEASGRTNTGVSDSSSGVGTPGKSEKLETPENSGDGPGMPEQHSPDAVGASGFSPRMIRGPSARQSGLPGLSVPPAGHRQVPEGETLTTPGAQSPDIPTEALAEVSELSTDLETTAPGAQSVLGNSFVEEKQAPLAERHNDLQAFSSVDSTRNPAFGVSPTGPSGLSHQN